MIRLVIAAALLAPVAAQAAEPAPSVTVRTADLNLSTPAGVARLDRRLAAAVTTVCPQGPRTGIILPPDVARCRAAARLGVSVRRAVLIAASTPRTEVASR